MLPLRRILLVLSLVATVVASVVDFPSDEDAAPPAAPGPRGATARQTNVAPAPAVLLQEGPRGRFTAAAADLFAVRNWQPPAPPVAAEPVAAGAPPLPFRFLGKLVEGGRITAFLGEGNRTHLARAGDVLSSYRVEQITATEMTFTYLPLNQQQRLTFGSSN